MPKPPQRPLQRFLFAGLFREPMFHFVLVGALIFGLDAMTAGAGREETADRDQIVVSDGRVRQLAQIFSRTWHRQPTNVEMQGLIDTWVKEEIYYREAVKLGLDRDDTLVRRRMQQKMEFLFEPDESVLTPTDAELTVWLEQNREAYRRSTRFAFRQILVGAGTESAGNRAERLLERLRIGSPGADPSEWGDRTLLPAESPLTPVPAIARIFGRTFANRLKDLPRDRWAGPVQSAYGLHLVRITAHEEEIDPPLAEVRSVVERDWRQAQRTAYLNSQYGRLRAKYHVVRAGESTRAAMP